MRFYSLVLLIALGCGVGTRAAQQASPAPKQAHAATTPALETEKVQAPEARQAPPATPSDAGDLDPAQLRAFLHKVWLAAFRISDLLTLAHTEGWELPDAARDSFTKTLEALRGELGTLEKWRDQFETRTDSVYLAYETDAAMGVVLPRLEVVVQSVTQHENPSLSAQYRQAENQLSDLRQVLQSYISFLLGNQDQVLLATQNNLAACQNELGFAMRGRSGPAKPIGNTMTGRSARKRSQHTAAKPEQK